MMLSANMIVAKPWLTCSPLCRLHFGGGYLPSLVLGACCWPCLSAFAIKSLPNGLNFILGALGMGVCGAFVYLGAMTTSATNIGIIYASAPIFIILMARAFFAEKLSYLQLFGVGVCLIGVVFILSQGKDDLFALEFVAGGPVDCWCLLWGGLAILFYKIPPQQIAHACAYVRYYPWGVVCLLPLVVFEVSQQGWPTLSEKIC